MSETITQKSRRYVRRAAFMVYASRGQLVRYVITGGSGVFLDLLTLYILKEFFRLGSVGAVAINQLLLFNYIFFMNKHWSFGAKGMTHRQITKFYFLAFANYLFSIAWMAVVNKAFGVNYLVARTANIGLSTLWNFVLYKFWVFAHRS